MLLTEFDPSSRAVIDPEMCVHPVEGLPEIAVSCFSHHLFEAVLAFFQPERICGEGEPMGKHRCMPWTTGASALPFMSPE